MSRMHKRLDKINDTVNEQISRLDNKLRRFLGTATRRYIHWHNHHKSLASYALQGGIVQVTRYRQHMLTPRQKTTNIEAVVVDIALDDL